MQSPDAVPSPAVGEPTTSVLVVAADSGPGLLGCVEHALASSAAVEVVVVDNASRDGTPQAVERAFQDDPRVRLVHNQGNVGFGPAVNMAARVARGDLLLVLNPDCFVESDTVARMGGVLHGWPSAGIVGALVCGADGVPDPASWRRDPLLARALRTLMGRDAAKPGGEGVNVTAPIPERAFQVENVSGALMLLPRGVFERLGGFDEGYFLHCEDLDLCRRARDSGYAVVLAGDVRVRHVKGGSSSHRPVFVSWHKHRGMWRWFRKFDPAARRPLVRSAVACGVAAHFVVGAPFLWLRRHRR